MPSRLERTPASGVGQFAALLWQDDRRRPLDNRDTDRLRGEKAYDGQRWKVTEHQAYSTARAASPL